MGEEGNLRHRATVNPVLLDVIGPVRRLQILDLGCGNGYLTRRFARDGAVAAWAVDRSPKTLTLARRRFHGHQLVRSGDAGAPVRVARARLASLKNGLRSKEGTPETALRHENARLKKPVADYAIPNNVVREHLDGSSLGESDGGRS
jgi:SAM-dependent methyltransferase